MKFPKPKNMDEFMLQEKARENPSFYFMLKKKKDTTKLFEQDLLEKTQQGKKDHIVITCTGRTGSGKSLTMMTIAKKLIDPAFGIRNICFNVEQVLQRCKELKQNSCLLLDEQISGNVGIGSVRESLELRNLEEVTRKYKLSFVFASPTPRTHMVAHYHMELFLKDEKNKVNWLAIHRDYNYLGYVKVKVDPNWELLKEYDKPDG